MIHLGKTIRAGQPGTKKWMERFGDKLLCVRYKYDFQRKMKIKTVELLVEEKPWDINKDRIPANKIIFVRVSYGEIKIRKLVKSAGGVWNHKKRLWELPYAEAIALGLEKRIVL